MKIITLAAFIAAAVAPAASFANELFLTSADAKSGSSILSLDLAATQSVGGFEFVVPLPSGVSPKDVNLAGCVSELPKNVIAKCDFFGAGFKVAVASTTQGGFSAGIVPVGKVTIRKYKGELQVTDLIVVGPDGNDVASTVSSNK